MIAEATKTERTVTPRLRGMASAAGGRLWEEGLKYKLKSVESLTRKLKGGETEPADVLRYTVIFPHEQLAAGAQKMLRSLPRGYQVMRVRNGWTTLKEGTNEPDVGAYRGINTVIQTKKGRRFELQFHTPESLAVKEAGTHDLYETVRNRRLPLKMRDEAKLAAGLYSETLLLPPPGVNRIKSFSRLDSKGAYIFEKRPRAEYDAIYEQDHMGRAVRATMHDARIVPPDSRARNLAAQAKVKREGDKDDHAGHLVANLFGGSGQRYNLAPMAGSALNLGSYRRLENELKRAAQSGRKVDLDVHAFYPDDQSRRPSGFRVTAAIDGKSFTTDFVNHAKTPEE